MPPVEGPPPSRLDSWKEIAAYLKREVRTVQRWEAKEGLPVHRHQHDTQVTVYAFPSELDRWLARRCPARENGELAAPLSSMPWWNRHGTIQSFCAVAVLILVAGLVWVEARGAGARLGFHARDWVLLAAFENRTGDPLFDGTLQYAFERELTNSSFVSVVPRERAEDALRLMRKPTDRKIDVATAREICLRDGAIRALLTGRAEKFGSTYVFSVQLLQPRDGRMLAAAEEQAAGPEQVWPAVRKLANWVRVSLGEQLASIQKSGQQLQQVTTPSLTALQLYTQAEQAGHENQWGASEQLVRQALESDSEFASGWIWLAWCLHNQRKPFEEYEPFSEKALTFSAKATERERLFILGSYHQFAGRDQDAVEAYSALARLYPDDFWGRRNLIYLCSPEEYPGLMMTYADLRPNDFGLNEEAAVAAAGAGESVNAWRYWDRARALLTPETGKLSPGEETEFRLFPVHEAWLRDDPKSGLEELGRITQSFDSLDPMRREGLATNAGLCYLGFGKVKAAEAWFEKINDEVLAHKLLALAAYAGGDDKLCWDHAAKLGRYPGSARKAEYSTGVALARAGAVLESERFIENYQKFFEDIFVIHLKGEAALAEGRIEEAIRLLQQATGDFRHGGNHEFLISSDGLALAFERNGEPQEALRVLEQASPARRLEYAWESPFGVFWLRIQAHLAQLYRRTGRAEEARKIEDQLRKVLAYADSDHPILMQLKRSS